MPLAYRLLVLFSKLRAQIARRFINRNDVHVHSLWSPSAADGIADDPELDLMASDQGLWFHFDSLSSRTSNGHRGRPRGPPTSRAGWSSLRNSARKRRPKRRPIKAKRNVPDPSADFLRFRRRLWSNNGCLPRCAIPCRDSQIRRDAVFHGLLQHSLTPIRTLQ
jgi:hypothetical protein